MDVWGIDKFVGNGNDRGDPTYGALGLSAIIFNHLRIICNQLSLAA
jgi:hypothetical protein